MRIWSVMPSLFVVCLVASSATVWADELTGIWPTCREPEEVEKAATAAHRKEWVTFLTMKCGLSAYRGTPVRVIRCAADVVPVWMKRFSNPVPRDESLPNLVCEVEASEDNGSDGIYYTYFMNIEKPPPLTNSDEVQGDELMGLYPTCWEPWEVEKAKAAVDRLDWVEWRTMKCGLYGDAGARVRVIRCAADVTPERMVFFSNPVPRDESLPDQICEVEMFYEDGGSGRHYTNFLNIEKSP